MRKKLKEAVWSTAFVNDLPDASFALILPGGEKDTDGKTMPRDLRKLPYKDADGKVDMAHLRNALARVGQVEGASAEAIAAAKSELEKAAEENLGGDESAATEPEGEACATGKKKRKVEAEIDVEGTIAALQSAIDALKAMEAPEEPEEPETPAADAEEPQAEPMESAETFTENAAPLALVEAETPTNRRAPLTLEVGIIKVGPGNIRDNHYYTEEMLARDGRVFEGAKMYATDHRNDEKSVRTEVSLVSEVTGVKEFEDGKYLTGKVTVFNPDFAEDVRNRADAGVLNSLHCSILAKGEAKAGKVGEQDYNIVQTITEAQSVDWVTRAGAGGHALKLAESAAEPESEVETQESAAVSAAVVLSEDAQSESEVIQSLPLAEVVRVLGTTNLPAASVANLSEAQYHSADEINAAIAAEVSRLKAAGSGQPIGTATEPKKTPTMAEIKSEIQSVNRKWLGGYR